MGSKWEPFIQSAATGLMAGKDLAGMQGMEKALAGLVMAMLDVWSKTPESELALAVDALFAALKDKTDPHVAKMGIMERQMLWSTINVVEKGRKAVNGNES